MEASIEKRLNSPQLPQDLIIQILLRTPVKSLLRFKLVSKTWYNFLKTPYFISMHHRFNLGTTVSQLLMCSHDCPRIEDDAIYVFSIYSNDKSVMMLSPELQIPADPNTRVYLLPGSCNGIVCYYDPFSSIFLSNPATREFKRLPPTSFHQVADDTSDQKWYQCGVAFGFDSANIFDFKVLCLFCTLNGMPEPSNKGLRAEMFTSSSNTWTQLHCGLDDILLFLSHDGIFCAGSFHFLVHRRTTEAYTILCCDIRTERFKTMELPSVGNRRGARRFLMVLKEFLSSALADYSSLEIWIMKDYGVVESWTKLYRIGCPWGHSIPKCFWIEDDALLLLNLQTNKLASCSLNTLHAEDVKIDGYNPWAQLVVYKETLVSIM